jgi:hypothetical protein
MAVRLTLEVGADAIEAAADILDTFADRSPTSSRYQVFRIAEKLREAASIERQDFADIDDTE